MKTKHDDGASSPTAAACCGVCSPDAGKMAAAAPADTSGKADSINAVIARDPRTIAVFNYFGIDACCGGDASVVEAAVRDNVDVVALVAALDALPLAG